MPLPGWLDRLGSQAFALFGRLRQAAKAEAGLAAPLANPDPQRYLDPAVLARVGFTPLLARVVVEGFLNGLHKSPFHGFSVEFAEHREYVPGDDLKYLDWALYARTDHYYIKRFEEETNLRCHILLDATGSMSFGTGRLTKWDYACFLSTCLAYLMVRQQDAVGLALLGAKPGLLVPPRCRSSHLRQLMAAMMRQPPAGQGSLPVALGQLSRKLKRRGLIVLVSDLIDDPDETLRAIKLLAGRRHEVIVFHVRDAAEIDMTFDTPAVFRDLETGEDLEVDPAAIREEYREQSAAAVAKYRKGLAELGIDYEPIDTRQSYDRALTAYLNRRARTRK